MTAAELTQRALAAHRQGQLDDADRLYNQALAVDPAFFDAQHMLGAMRIQQGRVDEAIALLESALRAKPDDLHALRDAAFALQEAKRYPEAVAHYVQALVLEPDDVDTLQRLGIAHMAQKDAIAAAASFAKAAVLAPDDPAPHFNLGVALRAQGDYVGAMAELDKVIALVPDNAIAISLRARAAQTIGRIEEAVAGFARAMALDPSQDDLLGDFAHGKSCLCDWSGIEGETDAIVAAIRADQRRCYPFVALSLLDDPQLQLECANLLGAELAAGSPALPVARRGAAKKRIHVAYLSANYYEHAVAYLIAELFERHDRQRFEVTAVSFGPDASGPMRNRIQKAVERFVDVRTVADSDAVGLLRDLDVDIAVDLVGYTAMARTGILALRAAPVQVNYLGYPGTMGAPFIDYIIADRFLVPNGTEAFYSEQVVRLPDCYQPNDTKRRIGERTPTRSELALPESAFVFCSFNNSFKINPRMFDVWMRLLRQVEGSVLWLLETSGVVRGNLQREAERRGVAGERLVFAPRVSLEEHLARHRCADLFLDTLPYNAHTTASDALWAGLPVLTCAGESFAARVAGSLLHAVGMPDLITATLADYEALALALARNPARLAEVRDRLARSRPTAPLFDIDRYGRHMEAAFEEIWARYLRGERPRAFDVAPVA